MVAAAGTITTMAMAAGMAAAAIFAGVSSLYLPDTAAILPVVSPWAPALADPLLGRRDRVRTVHLVQATCRQESKCRKGRQDVRGQLRPSCGEEYQNHHCPKQQEAAIFGTQSRGQRQNE